MRTINTQIMPACVCLCVWVLVNLFACVFVWFHVHACARTVRLCAQISGVYACMCFCMVTIKEIIWDTIAVWCTDDSPLQSTAAAWLSGLPSTHTSHPCFNCGNGFIGEAEFEQFSRRNIERVFKTWYLSRIHNRKQASTWLLEAATFANRAWDTLALFISCWISS